MENENWDLCADENLLPCRIIPEQDKILTIQNEVRIIDYALDGPESKWLNYPQEWINYFVDRLHEKIEQWIACDGGDEYNG